MPVLPFKWESSFLEVLDQRLLPGTIKTIRCHSPADVAQVIRDMAVRGAPAIGCCAAYGMALAIKKNSKSQALNSKHKGIPYLEFRISSLELRQLTAAAHLLKAARPTAVNLAWAVDKMMNFASDLSTGGNLFRAMVDEAKRIESQDVHANRAIGKWGASLLKKNSIVLTHCNAGALATAGYGTALGVIREGHSKGKIKKVFVDETRPYLQGARLTAWELDQEHIPHELITDNMAAHFMKTEKVAAVIVGCDRVAANGDTANKIGTYGVAVLARYHGIPFYVAMPVSTLDLTINSGAEIPIEDRSSDEVVMVGKMRIAPLHTRARHPAFDVTPASLITAIITEHGVVKPPYTKNLRKLKWTTQKP